MVVGILGRGQGEDIDLVFLVSALLNVRCFGNNEQGFSAAGTTYGSDLKQGYGDTEKKELSQATNYYLIL